MKIQTYKYLFRLVSYLTNKTNGIPLLVKYKIALGTILIGITGNACNTSRTQKTENNTNNITIQTDSDYFFSEPISCYLAADPIEIIQIRKDIFPILPNGNLKAFRDWVVDNIEYPEQMLSNRIEGKVNVSFVIDEQGEIKNITIQKSLCEDADKEIERILSTSPRWTTTEIEDSVITLEIPFEIKNVNSHEKTNL